MQVFISWSGDQSKAVAENLEKVIRHVIRGASTFISTHDIEVGDRWEARLSEELQKSHHAVLCITRDNQTAPWLNYEAGALAKYLENSKVIPYTLGFPPNELKSGPLTRFQGVQNDEKGTWDLVLSLSHSSTSGDDDAFVRDAFDMWWPRLRDRMAQLLTSNTTEKNKPTELELLLELRQDIRRLLNQIGGREYTGIQDRIAVLERELRDPLTSLPSRRAFAARVDELAANNIPYVIASLDLDHFRSINDEFGHARGDDLLVGISEILSKGLPRADFVARVGGDEFVAIFREALPEGVVKLMDEFLIALPNNLIAAGLPALNASCGVSKDRIESIDFKLRDAEKAMQRAKRDGGGHSLPAE